MHSSAHLRSVRASALVTVLILSAIMLLLVSSMLTYTVSERKANERNRQVLRAKNVSESISLYAAEQITTKLYRLRSATPMAFIGGTNQVHLPPESVLLAADPTYTSSSTTMEVYAGLTAQTGLQFINPATDPTNPNAGLQINTASVPIIAKGTSIHPTIGPVAAYTQNDLAVDFIPLFQFAVFYNMDLEMAPGSTMVIAGPVHTNGNLIARCQTGTTASVQFTDRVSAYGGLYANTVHKGNSINENGVSDTGPGGTGPLYFQNPAGTVTDLKSATSVWRDHKYGGATETTTTQNNFKVFANTTYGVNLRTSVHTVPRLVLPSVSNYAETDNASTAEDERDNGRQIIEPAASGDTAGLKATKIARRAGLYIIVNPDDEARTGYLPDSTAVSMRARSYRAFLNTVNADLSHTITEVILPGQPSYGDNNANVNNLPNAYRTNTAIGHNQVLRTVQGGGVDLAGTGYSPDSNSGTAGEQAPTYASFADAYFYDQRRAKNNTGYSSSIASGTFRASNPYTLRPIVKIDLDLVRLRMMVERTLSGTSGSYAATDTAATIYDPNTPAAGNWSRSIYNASATPAAINLGLGGSFTTLPTSTTLAAADPFRMYFAPSNPADARIASDPGVFAVGGSDLVSTSSTKPWFDGITIYVHSVDAEVRADGTDAGTDPDRIDSAVRLWNGRGPVISLDGATYPNRTGFTFCTNDAAYIVGHFNADGSINSTPSSVGTGGYSARYPESASERLCSVMADAITILSAPIYTSTGYVQSTGWSDSLSAHRKDTATGYTTSWATTAPSSSNRRDGVNTSFKPAALPWQGNMVPGAGAAETCKLAPTATEVSTCLLMGLVPTNHNATGTTDAVPVSGANGQSSGGLHNFPRLLEHWNGTGLWIRGSMVAMFESRVAMEPWSVRPYTAAGRFWGLHESLRNTNHDLPLEPILLGARRLGFKEISATEYNTMKSTITALPH